MDLFRGDVSVNCSHDQSNTAFPLELNVTPQMSAIRSAAIVRGDIFSFNIWKTYSL
jgi:hypothetical protein